jgi:MFS family permease
MTDVKNEISTLQASTDPQDSISPYSAFSDFTRMYLSYLLGFVTVLSTFTATIYFPLIPMLSSHLSVSIEAINLTITIYVVCQAITPAFFASLADAFGRRPVLLGLVGLYVVASLGLFLNHHDYTVLAVLRAVQSIGGSATVSLAYGIIADITPTSERGKYLGPFLTTCNCISTAGPVIGGALTLDSGGPKWVFLVLLIIGLISFFAVGFTLPETSRTVVGNGSAATRGVWTAWISFLRPNSHPTGNGEKMQPGKEMTRSWSPLSLFAAFKVFTYPDGVAVLWMLACSYSAYYILQVAIPVIFDDVYHWNALEIGLACLPGLLGLSFGSWVGNKMLDINFKRMSRHLGVEVDSVKNCDLGTYPIERARYLNIIYIVLFEVGLLVGYGWLVHYRAHPAFPLFFQFLICTAATILSQTASSLLLDSFPETTSTAYSAGQMARCGLSAALTAGLQPLIERVGRGLCFTIIGIFILVSSIISVTLSCSRGIKWRQERIGKTNQRLSQGV